MTKGLRINNRLQRPQNLTTFPHVRSIVTYFSVITKSARYTTCIFLLSLPCFLLCTCFLPHLFPSSFVSSDPFVSFLTSSCLASQFLLFTCLPHIFPHSLTLASFLSFLLTFLHFSYHPTFLSPASFPSFPCWPVCTTSTLGAYFMYVCKNSKFIPSFFMIFTNKHKIWAQRDLITQHSDLESDTLQPHHRVSVMKWNRAFCGCRQPLKLIFFILSLTVWLSLWPHLSKLLCACVLSCWLPEPGCESCWAGALRRWRCCGGQLRKEGLRGFRSGHSDAPLHPTRGRERPPRVQLQPVR